MLSQLANTLEQLDLAAEHLAFGDANNARFALMLCDNIIELVLHQYAKDKRAELKANAWKQETYEHEKTLEKALGRWFDEKVRFAVLIGRLAESAGESIRIGHEFRNDVYHVGLQHEAILHCLASFYFEIACQLCADYEIRSWGYSPGQKLPERAQKYFKGDRFFRDFRKEYRAGCLALKAKSGHDDKAFAATLADHMDSVIERQDELIDYNSKNAPRRETRDQVVLGCQSWPLAFTEEGRDFARKNGFVGGEHLVGWLEQNYPFKFKADPIEGWRKRAKRLSTEHDSHRALKMYRSFMDDTADLREGINEATGAVDQLVEEQIARMREERAFAKSRE
jgi:hypothetical protein